MNIIIAGDGEVGFHLAKSLTMLDHNVTVVDPHTQLLKSLETESDLLTITGSSTSPGVLRDAHIDDCDLFLAVLHDESTNMIAAMLAKKLGAKKTMARISNPELLAHGNFEMMQSLGIDEMVCPERIAVKEITNLLDHTLATEFFDFSGGLLSMSLVRLDEGSPLIGIRRDDISLPVRVVAILRQGQTLVPYADFVFEKNDLAYVIIKSRQKEDLIKQIAGQHSVSIKKIMIAGGGRIGRIAARSLEPRMDITLIETDRDRCFDLAESLQRTFVINGDATDIELLKEEGIAHTDAFIAVTDSSETNILTCLHAKKLGVGRTICLVENTGFISLSQDIGIDTIINKKLITASYIARFIVGEQTALSSKWLSGTNAEIIEYVVGERSHASRLPLKSLGIPKEAIIGGIIRGRETILPTRETQLKPFDKVVVFALPQAVNQVSKLFK